MILSIINAQPYADELAVEASGLEALLENSWQELQASLHSLGIVTQEEGGTVQGEV